MHATNKENLAAVVTTCATVVMSTLLWISTAFSVASPIL